MHLIAGEEDPVVPIDQMVDIRRALTRAEVRLDVVPGAGHGVYVDAPDVFIDLVRSFIADGNRVARETTGSRASAIGLGEQQHPQTQDGMMGRWKS